MAALVSIVIPVYNAAPYLEACLKSVLRQTYQSLEVLIINDGSTDESEEIVKRFTTADSRLSLYSQENHGLGYTRNRGISLCSGAYVFFLDSDDLIPEKAIESLVIPAETHQADYAVGKVMRLTEERRYIPKRHADFGLYNKDESVTIHERPEMLQDSIACNKLWKREFLVQQNLLFTEGKYYEDLNMTMRAAVLAKKIAVTREVVYLWRVREDENKPSITQQQMKLQNTQDRLRALLLNRKWLVQSAIEPRIISEHDLKSLLDVVRLHVIKYSLVQPAEREEWQREISSFLQQIPEDAAVKLPRKERTLYALLKEKNYGDLLLFSEMYTNTETRPIVKQNGARFELQGENNVYDVTPDLKPKIVVNEITRSEMNWELRGSVIVPKASLPVDAAFYGVGRAGSGSSVSQPISLEQADVSGLYPYETQSFTVNLNPKLYREEAVYDFYFSLIGNDADEHQEARVRIHPSAIKDRHILKLQNSVLTLYRTKQGNLSLRSQKNTLKQKVKTLIKKILK
ncbi:glycosyltransferase family 2 protein [Peribacillus deserti]|uniref:Glycosyltransferase 2-like domain-containing protein n=1 Tax=Peribacillus deserti TaxID=673318 RepID=A0A2N5MBM2_9BACI|nr:glycosyltransferase family 2 protein [Peribacillus deserti]PLT31751.1 hypothetical protein CUU66_00890 [Peribacillus deserti]